MDKLKKWACIVLITIALLLMSPVMLITKYLDWLTDGDYSDKIKEIADKFTAS